MAERFTKRQGEYLAFIHAYMLVNKCAPAQSDIQYYFGVSSAAVHQMMVGLETQRLIERIPRQSRSIRLLVPSDSIPALDGAAKPKLADGFATSYPCLAKWLAEYGQLELGYDDATDTFARALNEGGMVWSGGFGYETPESWLESLEAGVRVYMVDNGIPQK